MKRSMHLTFSILAAALVAIGASPLLHAQPRDCLYEAERTAAVDAVDAELLDIIARAGALVVEGNEDASEVRVRGRACASDEELLEGIQLSAERSGTNVRIEALMPSDGWFRNDYARLDLVIEAPAGIAAEIEDSSGAIELRRLGAVTVDDSSGEITAEDITGSISIDDSSGEIYVARVGGDVEIDDSSGQIEARDIEGSVDLSDSSGSIDVADVSGSVTVRRDSSGSIRVAGVAGDFVVERDSSGGVQYRGIAGTVRVAGHD